MNRIIRNDGWATSLKDTSCSYINNYKSAQRYTLRAPPQPTVNIK